MTLMDDLHRVVSVQGSEAKIVAMQSAYWLYERNPGLSLDEQAEGFAFLVAAYLRATDARERLNWLYILQKVSQSRSHQIGSQADWTAFTQELPAQAAFTQELTAPTARRAMHVALVLLCDANDARYLSVLESHFDHPNHYGQALASWVALAYAERYTLDERVRPYLRDAETIIREQFASALARRRSEERAGNQRNTTNATEQNWTPLFPGARAWALQQFALADERIRREIQVRDCRASQKEKEEHSLGHITPGTLSASVQQDLAASLSTEAYERKMMQLVQTFLYNASFPIDDVALTVKLLADSALQSEEHRSAWRPIATAFETRRYVGTYLDWDRMVAVLPSLDDDRNDPKFDALRCVLECLSNAPEERFLDILQPYLDHPHRYVRAEAADAIDFLLRHLAHHCPEVIFLARQVEGTPVFPSNIPKTPEAWQLLKERLARFAHEARPYFHYYSI